VGLVLTPSGGASPLLAFSDSRVRPSCFGRPLLATVVGFFCRRGYRIFRPSPCALTGLRCRNVGRRPRRQGGAWTRVEAEKPMAHAGETLENPVTRDRITFLKAARDTNGESLELRWSSSRWASSLRRTSTECRRASKYSPALHAFGSAKGSGRRHGATCSRPHLHAARLVERRERRGARSGRPPGSQNREVLRNALRVGKGWKVEQARAPESPAGGRACT
jgi:hypothetical protein